MKIVHVIPSLAMGGAENLSLNIVIALKSLGHDAQLCCVMTEPEKGELFDKVKQHHLPYYYSYSKHEPKLFSSLSLARLFRRIAPDVVHSHCPRANSCAAVAAWIARVKCIASSYHNPIIWANKHQERWGRWTTRLQDLIICDAESIRKNFIDKCPAAGPKTKVVYPGIASLSLSPLSQHEVLAFKKEWGIQDKDRLIGIIARLAEVKDHRTLIDAAEIVIKKTDHVKFLIVGDGPLRERIRERISEKGLESHILMMGYINRLDMVLGILDLFTLTSLSEGFPLSILEAFAAAVPVVATDVGGIPEMIVDGENGYLVKPGYPDQLASKFIDILSNTDIYTRMKVRAKLTAEKFHIEKTARKLIEAYQEIGK